MWRVLRLEITTVKTPQSPRNSPQLHHQKTTSNHTLFSKHPSKTPENSKKPPAAPAAKKNAQTEKRM
jgi:hypothetical protein